jgi:hypothetical protein
MGGPRFEISVNESNVVKEGKTACHHQADTERVGNIGQSALFNPVVVRWFDPVLERSRLIEGRKDDHGAAD